MIFTFSRSIYCFCLWSPFLCLLPVCLTSLSTRHLDREIGLEGDLEWSGLLEIIRQEFRRPGSVLVLTAFE